VFNTGLYAIVAKTHRRGPRLLVDIIVEIVAAAGKSRSKAGRETWIRTTGRAMLQGSCLSRSLRSGHPGNLVKTILLLMMEAIFMPWKRKA
jgi:hypothetical protein